MKSSNRSDISPFIVMDMMEKARLLEEMGQNIVHMEVGQPSTPAPKGATNLLRRKLDSEALGYTVALGLPLLRKKITELYKDWYGITLNPERVIVTSGSSAAFLLAFTSLFDTGSKVGIGVPGYPSYRQILRALDINPILVKTSEEDKFQITCHYRSFSSLDGLLMASPANPTGSMLSFEALASLISKCDEYDVSFISDEIYHGIHFTEKAVSALEISDNCYVINSFSKYFSMTGWRIGWMVVPEEHVRRVERLAQNMFICAPHVSQVAAIGALDSREELELNLKSYKKNRELLLRGLLDAGFTKISSADGAFYIYAEISDFSNNSKEFAESMLKKAGVAITPGLDFDPFRGQKYVRFSYARSSEEIQEGVNRIIRFISKKEYLV